MASEENVAGAVIDAVRGNCRTVPGRLDVLRRDYVGLISGIVLLTEWDVRHLPSVEQRGAVSLIFPSLSVLRVRTPLAERPRPAPMSRDVGSVHQMPKLNAANASFVLRNERIPSAAEPPIRLRAGYR